MAKRTGTITAKVSFQPKNKMRMGLHLLSFNTTGVKIDEGSVSYSGNVIQVHMGEKTVNIDLPSLIENALEWMKSQ